MQTLTPIDHETAERLRDMLAACQMKVYLAPDVPEEAKERIVGQISETGFRLIDYLEGVVR